MGLLFKQLMGPTVLRTTVTHGIDPMEACARGRSAKRQQDAVIDQPVE